MNLIIYEVNIFKAKKLPVKKTMIILIKKWKVKFLIKIRKKMRRNKSALQQLMNLIKKIKVNFLKKDYIKTNRNKNQNDQNHYQVIC